MIVSTQTMPITAKVGEAEAIRLIARAGFDAYDITLNVIDGNPIFEDNYKEYLASGYTAGYFRLCKRNPKAQCLFYKELYALQPSLYNAAAYDMYCMYAGKKMTEAVKEHPAPLVALMMYLPAYVKRLLKESE